MASTYRRKGSTGRYRVKFRDACGGWRDVLGFTDSKASETMGTKLEQLAAARAAGETPKADLSAFVRGLPANLQAKLARWGLLDGAAFAGSKPLSVHLDDYKAALLAGVASNRQKGPATHKHAATACRRVQALLDGIGATFFDDVHSEDVGQYLAELRTLGLRANQNDKPKPLSAQTTNHWLQNAQSFFAWLIRVKRATSNPLHGIPKIQITDGKRKLKRRPLEHDEATRLLDTTREGPTRFKMPAEERYWIYRVALETGLRSSELRALTRKNFELHDDEPFVWLGADDTKNSQAAELPLRVETVAGLSVFLGTKHPSAAVFATMPSEFDVADMLRADLVVAGVDFENDSGRVDFHSLRGTCLSWLANAGVPPKVLQDYARHANAETTMKHYARTLRGSLVGAAARLPDLSGAGLSTVKATGTDNMSPNQTTPRTTPNRVPKRASACKKVHSAGGVNGRGTRAIIDYRNSEKSRTALQENESHQSDSNRRPAVYKTAALPTELRWRVAVSISTDSSHARTLLGKRIEREITRQENRDLAGENAVNRRGGEYRSASCPTICNRRFCS